MQLKYLGKNIFQPLLYYIALVVVSLPKQTVLASGLGWVNTHADETGLERDKPRQMSCV